MKISKNMLEIFKNLSKINNKVEIFPGNNLLVVRDGDEAFCHVTLNDEDSFPSEMRIRELNKFADICSKFDSPEIEIYDNKCVVKESENDSCTNDIYFFSVLLMKENRPDISNYQKGLFEFPISKSELKKIVDLATTQSLDTLVISLSDKGAFIEAVNDKDQTSNKFSMKIADGPFKKKLTSRILTSEVSSLYPSDYTLSIFDSGVIGFKTDLLKNSKDKSIAKSIEYVFAEKAEE